MLGRISVKLLLHESGRKLGNIGCRIYFWAVPHNKIRTPVMCVSGVSSVRNV